MKCMKDKIIKLLLVISLMIPFFMFSPVYASQKAVVTFDNDTYLTNGVADIYKIGTYELDNNVVIAKVSTPFASKFTSNPQLTDEASINDFVNKCVEVVRDAETSLTPEATVSINNGLFDTNVGDIYIALVRTLDQQKAVISTGTDNNYVTKVEHPSFSYEFKPMLYMDGVRKDSDPNPEIPCKYTRTEKLGELVIEKILKSYRISKPVTFVFKITKVKDVSGAEVNQEMDVLALTFKEAGKKKLIVKDIPVGTTIKVEEVYAGAGYAISGTDVNTIVIQQDSNEKKAEGYKESKVIFANDFNDNEKKGYGVSNTFVKKENGWDFKDKDLETGGTNE